MYKNIIFDLDGTLVDSDTGIKNSIRYALKALELDPDGYGDFQRYIGPPLYDTFNDSMGLGPEKAAIAIEKYREYYAKTGIFEAAPYPGVKEMLAALKTDGRALFLGTSKMVEHAAEVLREFGLIEYFNFVGGASKDGERRGKAQVLRWVIQENPGIEQDAIMVGDTCYDVEGAREVGLDTAAVLYGYQSRWNLEKCGARFFFDDVASLQAWLLSQ